MNSPLSRYMCYSQVQSTFLALFACSDVIKSRSHVLGYTGNLNRSLLLFDSISSPLTKLFAEFYCTEQQYFTFLI